jgi:hypothetical protein
MAVVLVVITVERQLIQKKFDVLIFVSGIGFILIPYDIQQARSLRGI